MKKEEILKIVGESAYTPKIISLEFFNTLKKFSENQEKLLKELTDCSRKECDNIFEGRELAKDFLRKNENCYYIFRHTNVHNSYTGNVSYEVEYVEIHFYIEDWGLVKESSKREIIGYIAIGEV